MSDLGADCKDLASDPPETAVRVSRVTAWALCAIAVAVAIVGPIYVGVRNRESACSRVTDVSGLDYRVTDMHGQGGRWVSPGSGETVGYSVTEDSDVWTLKGCGQ